MEFTYSREQQMVKKMLKEFAETEIAPISEEIDEKAEYPYETVAKLGELGVMGMPFPQEYGGAGTDYLTYIMAVEELSKVDASHGVIVQTHNALCCWPIYLWDGRAKAEVPAGSAFRKEAGGLWSYRAQRGNGRRYAADDCQRYGRSLASERNQDLYFRRRYRGCLCHYGNDR